MGSEMCIRDRHNTDNSAPAKNEVNYMINNNNQVSFHVAVDDIEAIQGIPFDRNAWAAGDGANGKGNRESIHVEICKNTLGANNPTFKKCEDNAVKVCAQLLKQFGLGIDRLRSHRSWSGKNCPSTTNFDSFKARVEKELKAMSQTRKYRNCVLYATEADRDCAAVLRWYKKDCIVKHVDDHIPWEAENLFVIGGDAKKKLEAQKTGERSTAIVGSDRLDTMEECLVFTRDFLKRGVL